MTQLMAGIDLHSNNLMIGILDLDGKRVASQKLPCGLKAVVKFLAPFKSITISYERLHQTRKRS